MAPLLEVSDLKKHFVIRTGLFSASTKVVRAVDGVSFTVNEGETLGLVGESGCGKSTLVKTLLFLEPPTGGEIFFAGTRLTEQEVTRLRRRAQIVFQDPYTSLPPRMRVKDIIADPLLIHRLVPADRHSVRQRVHQLMADVGLKPETADQFPHQFSGGQRQRIGIARALSVEPSLIIADEAISSLDVSVQAQILNLLQDLQERHRLTYIFVSHDLGIVKYMSHRIAVMYLGEFVELAKADDLYRHPLHPYTQALLLAIPSIHQKRQLSKSLDSPSPPLYPPQWGGKRGGRGGRASLKGEPPDPSNPPSGCKFHPRCPIAQEICSQEKPALEERLPGRLVACHFPLMDDLEFEF